MTWEEAAEAARRIRVLNHTRTMGQARAEQVAYGGGELTRAERSAVDASRYAPSRSATLDGASALRQLNGARRDGQVANDYIERRDRLERRSADLELLEDYGRAIGVPIAGVDHRPGTWPA